MRRLRGLAWLMAVLLVVALAASGAHVHRGPDDANCVACTFAHAPVAAPDAAPAVLAPEPTRETVVEVPVVSPAEPLRALHGSRAPPIA